MLFLFLSNLCDKIWTGLVNLSDILQETCIPKAENISLLHF